MTNSIIGSEMLQLVTFKLAGQKYAVDIRKVQEINVMKEITRIPNAEPYIEGAVNLRGKVVPVLNLEKKFGFPDANVNGLAKIVIMDVNGVVIGVLVDSASDVLRINRDMIDPPPSISSNVNTGYISGIAKLDDGLVIMLDMDKLINTTAIPQA